MKKIRYTNFDNITEILGSVIDSINVEKIENQKSLNDIWGNIVGEKFAKRSKPLSVNKKQILFVATETPAITNELFMIKRAVMKRLEPYFAEKKIVLSDVVFTHKLWNN